MIKHHCIAFLLLLAGLVAIPSQPPLRRYEFTQIHMGTQFRIVLYAPDQVIAKKAADAAFAKIAELDLIMSDYKATSELMQLCQKAGGEPTKVGKELFDVISRSLEISRLTDGAFDMTLGPVVRLWRRARRTLKMPAPSELAEARKLVGFEQVQIDVKSGTIRLTTAGMLLDLGGIAKGYAAQAALELLRQHGIRQALVAAGGDIVVGDAPPEANGWRIGVAPLDNPNAKPTRFLALVNAAVSTSGDAEQYVMIDGKRYSHIVDPKTGLGLTTRMSCTVVSKDGATSDALATALCVLGPDRGLAAIEKLPTAAALIVVESKKGQIVQASTRFAAFEAK